MRTDHCGDLFENCSLADGRLDIGHIKRAVLILLSHLLEKSGPLNQRLVLFPSGGGELLKSFISDLGFVQALAVP